MRLRLATCRVRALETARAGLLLLALEGCAQHGLLPVEVSPRLPPSAADPAERDVELERAIARRRQAAQRLEAIGDQRGVLQQWQILAVLAPDDAAIHAGRDAARAALARAVESEFAAGTAALDRGDSEAAMPALLRVLALQPDHAQAANLLRNIERQRIAAVQADRVARLRPDPGELSTRTAHAPRKSELDSANAFRVEQGLELLRTGDAGAALRELRRIADGAPAAAQKALRARIADEAQQRGAKADAAGERERALSLYEQAISLRADAPPAWRTRTAALKKALAAEAYEKGQRVYKNDVGEAIKFWETSLRHEANPALELRLQEARRVQQRLQQIEKRGSDNAAVPR